MKSLCYPIIWHNQVLVNLVQALHIFKYLDQNKNNEIDFDPAYRNVEDPELFQARLKAMKEIYPDAFGDMMTFCMMRWEWLNS